MEQAAQKPNRAFGTPTTIARVPFMGLKAKPACAKATPKASSGSLSRQLFNELRRRAPPKQRQMRRPRAPVRLASCSPTFLPGNCRSAQKAGEPKPNQGVRASTFRVLLLAAPAQGTLSTDSGLRDLRAAAQVRKRGKRCSAGQKAVAVTSSRGGTPCSCGRRRQKAAPTRRA